MWELPEQASFHISKPKWLFSVEYYTNSSGSCVLLLQYPQHWAMLSLSFKLLKSSLDSDPMISMTKYNLNLTPLRP